MLAYGILSKEGKTMKPPCVKPGFSYSLSCWDLFDRLIPFRPLGRSYENTGSSICCDARLYVLDPLQTEITVLWVLAAGK